jgi:hypothetical protein
MLLYLFRLHVLTDRSAGPREQNIKRVPHSNSCPVQFITTQRTEPLPEGVAEDLSPAASTRRIA